MFTCKFVFQKCRGACPSDSTGDKEFSVAHTGEVAEKKREIGAFGEQRRRLTFLENLLDQLKD